MADNKNVYEIGLAMAGAISAGAYAAGVVDFLFQALHEWVKRVCVNYQHDSAIRGAINDALADDADPRIVTQALRGVGRWTSFFADRIRATGSTGIDPNLAAVAIYNLLDAANRGVFTGQLVVSLDELAIGLTEFIHRSLFAVEPEVPQRVQ